MLAQSCVIAKGKRIRDVARLMRTHRGEVSRWVKKASPSFKMAGETYEYHWYECRGIGRVEVKRRRVDGGCLMIVKLRRGKKRHRDLTPDKPYVVIGIEADDLRILNDEGRPFLYPARIFTVIDRREPDDWISEVGEDGERYAYSPPLNGVGFFEDFFDGNKRAVRTFWRTVDDQLAAAVAR